MYPDGHRGTGIHLVGGVAGPVQHLDTRYAGLARAVSEARGASLQLWVLFERRLLRAVQTFFLPLLLLDVVLDGLLSGVSLGLGAGE